jgi:hypothetical protein
MSRARYVPFPDAGLQNPIGIEVAIQPRDQSIIAHVDELRRRAKAQHVWVALWTEVGAHSLYSPVAVELLGPDGAAWPCGHLSEADSPGWRRLLQLRFQDGVRWIWPAVIIEPDPDSWRLVFYH